MPVGERHYRIGIERHYRIGIERHMLYRIERHILYRIETPPLLYYRIFLERLENGGNRLKID